MVLRSFFYQQQMHNEPNKSDHQIMLISGPPSCGKTSLLFQFAFNSALEKEGFVVFICNRRRLESKPPYLSQSIDPCSEVFQRIQMKYVEDDEGIKRFFAGFHLHKTYPTSVIIDDFGDFFDGRTCQERYNNQRGKDLAMVRTLALCRDAITYANSERSEVSSPCKLLLSDTHNGDTPRLLFVYKRWIPSIFTIKGDARGGIYLLKSNSSSTGESERKKVAKYSIALQYLVLEEITEERD